MRRLGIFLLTVAAAASVARADVSFEAAGRIVYANPATKSASGLTERGNPCGVASERFGDLNGFDGYWIELPADAAGSTATMQSDAIDADVWFYGQSELGCALIGATDDPHWVEMATMATSHEAGIVPAGATHAIVDLVAGQGATFVFQVI